VVPGQELEIDNISPSRVDSLRGEGQCSALGDHDGDILGPGVSSETQENGDGGETHVSDKRTRGVEALVAVATIGAFMIEPAEG